MISERTRSGVVVVSVGIHVAVLAIAVPAQVFRSEAEETFVPIEVAIDEPAPAPVAEAAPVSPTTERVARASQPDPAVNPADPVADEPDEPPPELGVSLEGFVTAPGGVSFGGGDPQGVVGGTGRGRRVATRALAPEPARPGRVAERCAIPDVAARQLAMPRVGYTAAARDAAVEGLVRIRVAIDGTGRVTATTLLSSLHEELDREALHAAQRATFVPATHCGESVSTELVLGIRFRL